MSTMQRLTLIGLYNYDNTLFDLLNLPDGYDKDTFINALLLEHGEKLVMYTDLDFIKFSIGAICRKWYTELERIYQALTAEYDPTWNYDRHEEYTDEASREYKDNLTQNSTLERKVSAYNSSEYENSDKSTNGGGSKTSGDSKNKVVHKAHLYGNIGVTTATQMINEVLEQRTSKNLYGLAADIFANELLINIY